MGNFYTIVVRDQNGNVGKTKVPIQTDIFSPSATVPADIKAAVVNITSGQVIRTELSTQLGEQADQTPPTGSTPTVEDKLVATFRGADNSTQNIKVPGPIDGIYQTGSQQVDLSNTTFSDWAGALAANATTLFGFSMIVTSGLRIGTRKLLKE